MANLLPPPGGFIKTPALWMVAYSGPSSAAACLGEPVSLLQWAFVGVIAKDIPDFNLNEGRDIEKALIKKQGKL